jgi:hypothetical protein
MINFRSFKELTESTAQYHKDLLILENNLNVSMESNWMTRIMDSNIHALSRAFHPDKDFEGFCYQELTSVQVEKIEEFLQYLVYTWDAGKEPPAFIVYERTPAIGAPVKLECRSIEDAYNIIVDFVEHFRDDVLWRLED